MGGRIWGDRVENKGDACSRHWWLKRTVPEFRRLVSSWLDEGRLPGGDVTVAVEYSTLNYKDALCMGSGGGMVRSWPHVPGIDFAGVVEVSEDARYRPGDKVVLTGWRVGESWWGGYAEKARVKADWLVPLPSGMTTRQAMALGTAGFTAMLAVIALEAHGLDPDQGEVLVTGAAGGVGSVAVALAGGARLRGGGGDRAGRGGGLSAAGLAQAGSLRGPIWPKWWQSPWNPKRGRAASILSVGPCWRGFWGR